MNTTHHKILIAFAGIALIGGAYFYFSHDLISEAAIQTPGSTDSPLSSSSGSIARGIASSSGTPSLNDQIARDTAFLSTLNSLTKIRIDTTIFASSAFSSLRDNTVQITNDGTVGRVNPFAPISGTFGGTTQAALVVTSVPTQITNTGAVLTGSVTAPGITSSYFEYGPTASLGKVTASTNASLVGTFTFKVSGLSTKTTYFFRAVAKSNGNTLYGDIVSFETN